MSTIESAIVVGGHRTGEPVGAEDFSVEFAGGHQIKMSRAEAERVHHLLAAMLYAQCGGWFEVPTTEQAQ